MHVIYSIYKQFLRLLYNLYTYDDAGEIKTNQITCIMKCYYVSDIVLVNICLGVCTMQFIFCFKIVENAHEIFVLRSDSTSKHRYFTGS